MPLAIVEFILHHDQLHESKCSLIFMNTRKYYWFNCYTVSTSGKKSRLYLMLQTAELQRSIGQFVKDVLQGDLPINCMDKKLMIVAIEKQVSRVSSTNYQKSNRPV